MNLEKLKDTARKYEQKEDWRRAIDVYLKAIGEFESGKEPHPDLSLYNRVGDLYLKVNDPAAAVRSYERAADLYTEQGFLNNAIALCGKILRVNPGRVQTYYKLAQIHARKNMLLEAKRNLIEYLERMNHAGELDAAFEAVKVFADHFPANQEIRMMLIDLLRAASREDEARLQVEKVATELEAKGDAVGAQRTREQMPEPQESDAAGGSRSGDLIFLDTGLSVPPSPTRVSAPVARPATPMPAPPPGDLAFIEATPPGAAESPEGRDDVPALDAEALDTVTLDGLIQDETAAPEEASPPDIDIMLEPAFEETARDLEEAPGAVVDGLEVLIPPEDAVAPEGFEADTSFGDEVPGDLGEPLVTEELGAAGFSEEVEAGDDIAPVAVPEEEAGEFGEAETADEFYVPEGDEPAELDTASFEADAPTDELVAELVDGFEPASTAVEVASIHELEDLVLEDPDNPDLHRRLGEALLLQGETARATDEFELALLGYEGGEQREDAEALVALLITLHPESVPYYQKRVEYAYRTGDRERLLEAYLDLGDALVRAQADDKAAAVYGRVLEHEPHSSRARYGLEQLGLLEQAPAEGTDAAAPAEAAGATPEAPGIAEPTAEDVAVEPPGVGAGPGDDALAGDTEEITWEEADLAPVENVSVAPPAAEPPAPPRAEPKALTADPLGFVDLGSLIMEEEGPRDSRMKGEQLEPTGDEQRDFDEMLAQFKKGIDENLSHDDYEAHYDLGIAFKEMGLYDEAIAEFQKALRAPEGRLRTSEALGVAFFEKGQFPVAEAVLRRAVDTLAGGDDEKIGLIYWLGRSCEVQGKDNEARQSYERAMAQDIRFMDLRDRVNRLTAGHK